MLTQIKRSIPDLRSIKHQPLENKESPPVSPRHQRHHTDKPQNHSNDHLHVNDGERRSSYEKETDAVTLSALQTTECTCGAKTTADASASIDKTPIISDDVDPLNVPHSSGHHHQKGQQPSTEIR